MKIRLCAISLTCFFLCVASEGTPDNVTGSDPANVSNEEPTKGGQLSNETTAEETTRGHISGNEQNEEPTKGSKTTAEETTRGYISGNEQSSQQYNELFIKEGKFYRSLNRKYAVSTKTPKSIEIKSDMCPENYQLAEPHTKEELKEMVAFLTILANERKIKRDEEVRFGANRTREKRTVWMTHRPFILFDGFYADGEPNNRGGNEFCVGFKLSVGGSNDYPCDWKRHFICMRGKTRYSVDGSMVVNFIRMNFSEARKSCPYGFMLGEFYTEADNHKALKFLLKSGVDKQFGIFIGLYLPLEYHWRWLSNALYIEQKNMWATGEPYDPTGDEFCGSFTLKLKGKKSRRGWNNVNCGLELPSICTQGMYQYSLSRKWLLKTELKDFKEAKEDEEIDYPFAVLLDMSDYNEIKHFLSKAEYDKYHSVMLGAISHEGSPPVWLSGRPIDEKFYSAGHHPVPRQKGKTSICVAFTLHGKEQLSGLKTLPCDTKLPRLYKKGVRCPDGYEEVNSICIRGFPLETTYFHAIVKCEEDHAVLSSIQNSEINDMITTIMDYKKFTSLWIGMDKEDGGHVWIDGSEMNFTSWAKGEPRLSNGLCVIISQDGTWAAEDCDSELPFVCIRQSLCHETICPGLREGLKQAVVKRDRPAVQGDTVEYECLKDHLLTRGDLVRLCRADGNLTGNPAECSPKAKCGTYSIPGSRHCYKLNYTKLNYFDAVSDCENDAGVLVSPKDEEDRKVTSYIMSGDTHGSKNDLFWINVNDIEEASLFVAGDDYPLEFTPWDEDEPHRTKDLGQHCVATTRSGRWRVVNCRRLLPFMCERPGIGQEDVCNTTEAISELENAYAKTKDELLLEGSFLETECNESHVAVEGDRRRQCVRGGFLSGCPLKCSKQVKCDKGWLPGYRDCYKPIVFTKKGKRLAIKKDTLYRATIICQSLNSSVVSVTSTYDAYLLSEIIRKNSVWHENIFNFLWLSLTYDGYSYQWQSGRESDYSAFETDISDQHCRKVGYCVKMNMFGTWFDENCNEKHHIVCQKSSPEVSKCQPRNNDLKNATYLSTKTVREGEMVEADCNDGFVAIRGDKLRQCLATSILSGSPLNCVQAASCSPTWQPGVNDCRRAIKEKLNQTDAHKYCKERLNSSLAEIHDTLTWKLSIDIVRQHNFFQMWIDADDSQLEGSFISNSTKRKVVSGMWDEGEPSNIGDQGHHCVIIKDNGALGSRSCKEKHSFICVRAY